MDWENRSAFVFIKAYPGMAEELYDKIQHAANLFCVFMTTGDYDMVAWIDTAGIGDAYNWICEVRSWPQVERTSCCPTYHGHWNEESFRHANYHAWMKVRSTDLNSPFEYAVGRETAAFAASIPGEFDCIVMFCCEDLVGDLRRGQGPARERLRDRVLHRLQDLLEPGLREDLAELRSERRDPDRRLASAPSHRCVAPAPWPACACGHLSFPCRGCLCRPDRQGDAAMKIATDRGHRLPGALARPAHGEDRDQDRRVHARRASSSRAISPMTTRPAASGRASWSSTSGWASPTTNATRARMLAELGYVAFAVDVYGKGVRPANAAEAQQQAGKYYGDRTLFRARLAAGLAQLKANRPGRSARAAPPSATASAAAACSNWRASGADLAGVVSFHGSLDTPMPATPERHQGARSWSATAPSTPT